MSDSTHTSDSFVFKTDRPWPNPPLQVAAIVGHATPTSVRLWLRTGRTGEFSLLLYPESEVGDAAARRALRERLAQVPLTAEEAAELLPEPSLKDFTVDSLGSDTTTVLDLTDLEPDTRYGYVLHARDAGRVLLGHNRSRGFRTPSAYEERRPFQFALFSCHMPYKQSGLLRETHRGSQSRDVGLPGRIFAPPWRRDRSGHRRRRPVLHRRRPDLGHLALPEPQNAQRGRHPAAGRGFDAELVPGRLLRILGVSERPGGFRQLPDVHDLG